MTAGRSNFASLASSSLPTLNGGVGGNNTAFSSSNSNYFSGNNVGPFSSSSNNNNSSNYAGAMVTTDSNTANVGGGSSSSALSTFVPTAANTSSGGINIHRLQELSSSLRQPTTTSTNTTSTSTKSIQEIIQERRQNILNNLFTEEMEKTRQRCDELHTNRMKKDWEEERNLYMEEIVGDRRLGGSSGLPKYKSMTPSLLSTNNNNGSNNKNNRHQFKYRTMDHINIIQKWSLTKNKEEGEDDERDVSVIYDFVQLSAKNSQPAYSEAWKLLYALKRGRMEAVGRAISTLSHLGRQFQAHIANAVRSATANRQTGHISSRLTGMARTVETFVSLTLGSDKARGWATVYYCLRCGDFVSAKEALYAHDRYHVLYSILNQYAQQQGSQHYYWDEATMLTKNNGSGDITMNTFSSNYNNSMGEEDKFEKACWSLLVGTDREDPAMMMEEPVVKTMEDFVYMSIWYAIFGSTRPDQSLAAFGESIKKLGPRHFQGDDSSDCWSYVMPLLLSQQYETSMLHLAKGNGDEGILQATHLAIFLESTRDLSEESSQNNVLTSLLTEFTSHVVTRESTASNTLLYLVRIPDPQLQRKKIVELIVDSRHFEELGGSLSQDGNRRGENATLDKHYSSKEVCTLLEEAARMAYEGEDGRTKNDKDALELLHLAEKYVQLLSLLNQKLATFLKDTNTGHEREFWLNASNEFNNWHFNGRRTRAIEVLEAADRVDLVDVFHTLLKLFDFFNKLMMHDFENATPILDSLYLFPRSEGEVAAKVQSYNSGKSELLRDIFPSVVLGAMDVVYQQFVRTKHKQVGNNNTNAISVIIEYLKQLKNRAVLLNSFSCALGLPLDVQSRMTSMEAQMV